MNNITPQERRALTSSFDVTKASASVITGASELYSEDKVEQIDGSNFVVNGGSQYEVTLDRPNKTLLCNCKGYENYQYCKHAIAVKYFIENSDRYDDSAPMTRVTKDDMVKDKKPEEYIITDKMQQRIDKLNKASDETRIELKTQIPTLEINYDMYLPIPFGNYIPLADELETILMAIEEGLPFLIEGDKGIGKTLAVNTVCCKNDIAEIGYSCSSGTTMGDILGREHLIESGSVFELGLLPTAIMTANHFGKGILYLDELNALEPEIQKMLNSVIDDRRSCHVNGHIYRLKPDTTFCIVATMNPSTYAGTSPLNEDLRSRFCGEVWKYPSGKHLTNVCDWSGVPKGVQKNVLQLAMDSLGMKQRGEVSYVLSTRDVALFTKCWRAWQKMGKKSDQLIVKTLQTSVLIKFGDADDRNAIRKHAENIFAVGIPLD